MPSIGFHASIDALMQRVWKQTLGVMLKPEEFTWIDRWQDGDIVLFQGYRTLDGIHNHDQRFILTPHPGEGPTGQLPENVATYKTGIDLLSLTCTIQEVAKLVTPRMVRPVGPADAPSVLVVDDKKIHVEAAWRQLGANYKLAVVTTFTQALAEVKRNKWEYLLTDLMLPAPTDTLGQKAIEAFAGKEEDMGLILMLLAAEAGVPKIAVVTDAGHHDHPMSAAFDRLRRPLRINDATVRFSNYHVGQNGKNWEAALRELQGSS